MATFTTRAFMAAALLLRKEFRIRIATAPVHYRHKSQRVKTALVSMLHRKLHHTAIRQDGCEGFPDPTIA